MPVRRPFRLLPWLREAFTQVSRSPHWDTSRPRLECLETRDLPAAGIREQHMLELLNRMRTNPAAELNLILNSGNQDVNDALTFFNVNRTLLQQQWNTLTPQAPLAWNDSLASSALAHSQLMLQFDEQSHNLPGEPDLLTRTQNAGYSPGTVAENIFSFGRSVFHMHAAFAIDWGTDTGGIQNPPGHRINIMDATFRDIGISILDSTPGKNSGPLLVTQDLGVTLFPGNPFVLGVAYRDLNANGFYDPGEGIDGATVTLTGPGGPYTTTTSPAGGYQVRVPAGNYTVTFSGGGLVSPQVRQANVGNANVKVDLNTAAAPMVQFANAAFAVRENAGSLTVSLTRTGDSSPTVGVRVQSSDGTARAGTDYSTVSTTVTFAANETQKTVTIPITNNSTPQNDRIFMLSLGTPTGGATVGNPNQTTITIQDDDAVGQLGFGAATFSATEGTQPATVTVVRTNGTRGSVTVAYATTNGSATIGVDYSSAQGTLTFADGENVKSFTVLLTNNTRVEADETVQLTLSTPGGGATLSPASTAVLRIQDDDMPVIADTPAPTNLISVGIAFAHSREHFVDFITKAYVRYLGRGPDSGGLNFWANSMQAGLTDEQLETNFLGSPEYIANHGGTGREWVKGMYRDLLGREASSGEADYWTGQLNAGLSTYQVAFGFAASAERAGQRIRDNYRTYLQREPSDGEVQQWVNTFLRGFTTEDMAAGFVSSAEYYHNATKGQGNAAHWVASAYRDVLYRDPEKTELEGWLLHFGLHS